MNCEKYQELLSDLVDGRLVLEDRHQIEAHLMDCVFCAEVRDDFVAIVGYCQDHRGEYAPVPNERALWLRISNIIEAESHSARPVDVPSGASWWFRLMNKSWQLSFPKLAASAAALVAVVALATVLAAGRLSLLSGVQTAGFPPIQNSASIDDRYRQQQQAIAYWNQRVELNKARWSAQMRETFDRNMGVIDAAVNDSMVQLRDNPHDTVSEDILNDALNDKVALLKEFAEL
jgi:anti-sigma factor RsiW